MDIPYPTSPPRRQTNKNSLVSPPPCYPRGEGDHFRGHPNGLACHPTHPMPQWTLPPPPSFHTPILPPVPPSSSPPQPSHPEFKASTILQRHRQEQSNRDPHEGTPSPPPFFPPWNPNFTPSPPTSKRINSHPPQLPELVPAYPIVLEPQLEHGETKPYVHAGVPAFIGAAKQTQREDLPVSPHCRFPLDAEVDPVPAPQPSPGPSFTTTPPASIHRPEPVPISPEEARLNTQVGGFIALVEAKEQEERVERQAIMTKERKGKGVRGRMKSFFQRGVGR